MQQIREGDQPINPSYPSAAPTEGQRVIEYGNTKAFEDVQESKREAASVRYDQYNKDR